MNSVDFTAGRSRNGRTGSRFVQALAWLQIAVPLGDVTPPPNHQHTIFKQLRPLDRRAIRKIRKQCTLLRSFRSFEGQCATLTIPFESSVGGLVHLGYTHCCASTWCLSTWSSPTSLKRFLILELVSRLDAFSGYPFPT